MWLTEKTALKGTKSEAEVGTVTIGGINPGVMTDREERDISVYTNGGYTWRPKAGDRVLVIKCGDGTSAVVGKQQENEDGIESGEVYIKSEGAAVKIKNSGEIEIYGRVNILGGLIVNGNAIG